MNYVIFSFLKSIVFIGLFSNTLGNDDFPLDTFEFGKTTEIPKHPKNNFTISSELVKNFLEHFKSPDSLNLPLPIPDPFNMPNRIYPILAVKVSTTNVTALGVSRIRVENFTADIVEMKVHFALRIPKLQLTGNYSYFDWVTKRGRFNVTLLMAYTDCAAKLEVTRNGELEASDIIMDLVSREKLWVEIENADLLNFFMSTFGDAFFNAIKPYFFSLISNNIRGTVNDGLKQMKMMFPNSIVPLDLGIAEARKFIRNEGFDPYYVPDYQYATSIYSIDITHIMVTGISSVYRFGDVKLSMDNHIINIITNIESEELEGSCVWEAGIGGIFTKLGSASFSVEYINIMISVNQSLDVRNKPKIVELKIKLGNIQLRMDGAGILDYMAELGTNTLPNILRYQIVQAAEMPMKRKVQEILDNTDIEQYILDKLPMIDEQLYQRNQSIIEHQFVEEELIMKTMDLEQELFS